MDPTPTFTIYETPDFAKWVRTNRLTAAVTKLKADLHANPEAGDVIRGGGGLRKVRMAGQGRGKQSGFRVIYVLFLNRTAALLVTGYSKSQKEDITQDELADLVRDQTTIVAALTARIQASRSEEQS